MKKFFLSILFLFFCINAFCIGGNVFHHKNLSVIKTEYFDIIFDDETFNDAKKIASAADSYYLEITKKFDAEPYLRFPVVLSREVENLNGFYSPFPYNMIVLYVADSDSPEMQSYSDTLLSVFYHELTHAVTLNMKSPLFKKLSKIFGDFASPAALSMTYFWIEGAAVLSESGMKDNGGRLKNPYFTSLLVQAKINDKAGFKKFPSWRDVAGARDTTPGGSDRYVFGACFAEFLVQNYGMEKYAEFWKNAGKSTNFAFSAGVFKKTYGKKIDDVWQDFKDSIKIPENSDSVDLDIYQQNSFLLSHKKAFVQSLDVFYDKNSGGEKIVFYDSASRAVFFYDLGKNKKQKKLFSSSGIYNLKFSDDGKKIFVARYTEKETVKIENGIFDIEKKKYKVLKKNNLEAAKKKYLESQVSVEKEGLSWKIIFKNKNFVKKYFPEFSNGEKILLTKPHLFFSDENFAFVSFSWAEFAQENDDYQNLKLPRAGILKINLDDGEGIFYLQKKEIFVQNCAHSLNETALLCIDETQTKILALLEDYDSNPLYEVGLPPLEDESSWEKIVCGTEKAPFFISEPSNQEEKTDGEKNLLKIEKFSSLPYLLKGTKLPVGLVPLKNSGFETESTAFLGATYITSKPFLSDFILISAGYDPFFNDFGAMFHFTTFDESKSFSSSSSAVFDRKNFKQVSENFAFSKKLWRGLVSSFSAGISGDAVLGRTSEDDFDFNVEYPDGEIRNFEGKIWKNGFFARSKFYLSFSNLHKVSPKQNQIFGFKFQPFIDAEYKNFKNEWKFKNDDEIFESAEKKSEKYVNAGFSALARFPGFFPASFQAAVFPSSSYFAFGSAGINLLSLEIQKGIPAVSIYATRFDLNFSYSGWISYEHGDFFDIADFQNICSGIEKDDYKDKLSLSSLLTFSPNTSYGADSSVQFQIGASVFYRPNPNGKSKAGFEISGKIGS